MSIAVDGRINRIYRYTFPAIIVLQSVATYLKLVNPRWWAGCNAGDFRVVKSSVTSIK